MKIPTCPAPLLLIASTWLVPGPARAQGTLGVSSVQHGVRVAATMAELRTQAGPSSGSPRCARVLGYHAPGDGGGGEFWWDAASVATDDGGITILPTGHAGAGRWVRLTDGEPVSIRWFGATPNDGTDDHAAIQAAIEYAQGVVGGYGLDFQSRSGLFVPAGVYDIEQSLRISAPLDFFGVDASASKIRHQGATDVLRILGIDEDNDGFEDALFDVSVRRLTLEGDGGPSGQNPSSRFGIYLYHGVRACSIENVVITRCQTGLFLRRCYTANVVGCTVMYCSQNAIKWENATAGMISGCRFDVIPGSNHCAFITYDHTNEEETLGFLVESSSFQGAGLAGLYCRDVGNLSVVSCFFENNNRSDLGYGALHLEDVTGGDNNIDEHVVNVVGGFFTPGPNGMPSAKAIYVQGTSKVNLIGVDVRGSMFQSAIQTGPAVDNVNLVGCNFHGRPRDIHPFVTVSELGSD